MSSTLNRGRRVLALSFAFPPLSYPNAIQVARLLRRLAGSVRLICADEKRAPRDDSLEPDASDMLEACVRVPFSPPRWRQAASWVAYRLNIPVWDNIPDRYRPWVRPALGAAERLVASGGVPDVVVTFGQPMSTHEVGLALRLRHGWPWIAHFSDPWSDNPYRRDRWSLAANTRLERQVVEAADRLVFVCNETADLVMQKYPRAIADKVRVVPHGFDAMLFPAPTPRSGPLVIRHVGNFYELRTPSPLVQVLRRLLREDAKVLENVKIELVGFMTPAVRYASGIEALPPGLVTIVSPVSYRESLVCMSDADGLLVIDAPAKRNVFLPSKLIEYLGAGRPILGMTPPGASASLISRLGGWVADPSSGAECAQAFSRFVEWLCRNRGQVPFGDASVRQQYEASAVARSFEAVIDDLFE